MGFTLGSKCEKLIKYQTRDAHFSGKASQFAEVDFKTSVKLQIQPDKIATSLDDYQYHRCKDAERCKKDDPKRVHYFEKRDIAIDLLTNLRVIINSASIGNKEKIEKRLEKLHDTIDDILQADAMSRISEKLGRGVSTPRRRGL